MAFRRYARALTSKRNIQFEYWMDELRKQAADAVPEKHVMRTAKQVLTRCDPKQYLLSHATIVASVDTYAPKDVKLGRSVDEKGCEIDVRFADHVIKPESEPFINNNCCVPGTMILMGDGTEKPIEDVRIGDGVVSHTGYVREVTNTFVHPFKGYVKTIHKKNDGRKLSVSSEHPIWCSTPQKIAARTVNPGEFSFRSAGLINKLDLLAYPILQGVEKTTITEGKAKLIGYFLAEGYYYKQSPNRVSSEFVNHFPGLNSIPASIIFALNADEEFTLAADIVDLLQKEFGVKASIKPHRDSKNCINVVSAQSLELVKFFSYYCGEEAKEKRLAPEILQWPIELQRLVIQKWFEGDGTVKLTAGGWLSVTTVSSKLISQAYVLIARLGLIPTRLVKVKQGRKRERQVNGGWLISNDYTKTCTEYTITINSVDGGVLIRDSFLSSVYEKAIRNRKKHNYCSFRSPKTQFCVQVKKIDKELYEGPIYNFETDIDHSYVANGVSVHNSDSWSRPLLMSTYRTFVGAPNFLEHIQVPALSKGFIVDAIARDIGVSCYVDILVATDRKHTQLINDILSGKMSAFSMGCISAFTMCNRCGNVATDDSSLCSHISYDGKGTTWVDRDGQEHKLAELIGHVTVPNSNQFIEASWVHNPAFRGAVRRNLLNADEIVGSPAFAAQMEDVSSFSDFRNGSMDFSIPSRAASIRKADDSESDPFKDSKDDTSVSKPDEDFDADDGTKDPDDVASPDSSSSDDSDVDSDEDTKEDPKSPKDKIHGLADKIKQQVLEMVVNDLSDELSPDASDVGIASPPNMDLNDTILSFDRRLSSSFRSHPNLITWASKLNRKLHTKSRPTVLASMTSQDLIVFSWIRDICYGRRQASDLYKAAITAGALSNYNSDKAYLAACRLSLGRALSVNDSQFLLQKGRIASLSKRSYR